MNTISALLNGGDPVVAVVGATDNPRKYGNRIYLDLKRKGFRVYPVNPSGDTVDGDPAYPKLSDLPETPDIVNFVVPPPRTLRILEQARGLGVMTVWVQPGAENEAVTRYLDEHGFDYVTDDCIMVRTGDRHGR
ncbi:MAG: CoA-binding protein [Actinomycetota bacterium]|nr:CoA-binding protein [Actinomycetota bacterium]